MSSPPIVGMPYQGSTVVKVDEQVEVRPGGRTRRRSTITLENGMVLVEDVYEATEYSDIQGEYKEIPYQEIEFPKMEGLPVLKQSRRTGSTSSSTGKAS